MSTDLTTTRRIEDATAYRLLRLGRLLRYSLATRLEGWGSGLRPEQFFILFKLVERDGRAQGELVDPWLDDRANITRLVTSLTRAGLVQRRADPADGRVRRVWLTPAGRALFERLRPRIVAERQRLFAHLEPADLAAFERVIDDLEATLSPTRPAGARTHSTG